MIPEDLEALALAAAIGALDREEQLGLEARVAQLPEEQRVELARLYDVALAIGAQVEQVEPHPRVRERIMAGARAPGRYTLRFDEQDWADTPLPGIQTKMLAIDRTRGVVTMLIRARAGAVYPSHRHSGPEECYVISGTVVIDGRVLRAGDFHHADAGSDHGEITTTDGAEVLIVGAIDDYLPNHP